MSMLWQFAKLVAGYDDNRNYGTENLNYDKNQRKHDAENDQDYDPIPGSEADMIGPYGDDWNK